MKKNFLPSFILGEIKFGIILSPSQAPSSTSSAAQEEEEERTTRAFQDGKINKSLCNNKCNSQQFSSD